ncbi:hypothetical protein BC937DRAFT_92467 [Endogone sp. FLAS-F59071]|nr:hypothetical protein BC937DRAFT_92467 [Endogone sp. FLAS-F59071]|eukprot:RUS21498.1 hypothetical protein BC937DRAFT_92467 [Endogone sp. FLAS-F59071]
MLVLEMHQDMTKPNQYGKYQGFGATVSSIRSIVKGNLTARLRTASSSPGVVSSWITRNKHGDELDFEFVGKSPHQVQTNWYYNNVIDWTHGKYFDMPQLGDLNASFHEYMISWGDMQARWFVDGQCMGVLELNESDMFSRPQQWHFSVWDGGSGSPDTTNWAGGPTDWSDVNRIYRMEVDWVQVQCSQEMTGDQRKTEWDVWHRPNASTSVPGAETSLGPFPSIPPVPTSGSKGLLGDFWVLAVVVVVVVVEVITYLIFSI